MTDAHGDIDALGVALQRAAGALRVLTTSGTRPELLAASLWLDDALSSSAVLLDALPAFLEAADPGEVSETTGSRARALAEALPELGELVRCLTEQTAAFADPVLDVERALELAARNLDLLSRPRLDALHSRVAQALAEASAAQARAAEALAARWADLADAERRLAYLREEVAEHEARAAALSAEHQELDGRLRARLAADKRVAASLTGLREVDRKLNEVDTALASALRAGKDELRTSRGHRFPED